MTSARVEELLDGGPVTEHFGRTLWTLVEEVTVGRLLCRIGRHRWLRRRVEHLGTGTGTVHQVCMRCGRERAVSVDGRFVVM